MKIKYLTIGAILAAITALIQLVPFFFSEMFVLVTMLSAIPIYIIARLNLRTGILTYLVAGALILLFSVHEGLLFYFTNGFIGVSLGCLCNRFQRITLIWPISTLMFAAALIALNYGIGIPVFGGDLPGNSIIQVLLLLGFSFLYNILFFYAAGYIFQRLKRIGIIDKFL